MLGPLFVLATAAILAQEPQAQAPPPGSPQPQGEALRVFLDCQYECDLNYLRTEITFVNWVRDRYDGQVIILVTSQETGGQGTDYTLTFIGQREFLGRTDTLHYIAAQGATGDERRGGMARLIRLGLVRYTMTTPLAAHLDVRFTPPGGGGAAPREQRDPWNRWVFRASVNSNLDGEASNASHSWSGSLSANRVTEEWKVNLDMYGRDSRSRYTYPVSATADTTIRTTQKSWSASGLVVRSLGAHWSAGLQGGLSGSTSGNIDIRSSVGPAIEYDLFPYAQSTRRQLTFNYSVGIEDARYHDTTIYFKTSETYFKHQLEVALALRQPWGSASVSVSGTQYWNDAPHPNLNIYGSMSVRLVRGLSLNTYGSYSFVRSQRYLSAEGATPDEVLLQLRQMRTSYRYFGSIGFSYTFGSVYNNVVNPRFGGGGGMMFFSN
jgi:hypothetical protein